MVGLHNVDFFFYEGLDLYVLFSWVSGFTILEIGSCQLLPSTFTFYKSSMYIELTIRNIWIWNRHWLFLIFFFFFAGVPDVWSVGSLQEQQTQHFYQTDQELQSPNMTHSTTSTPQQAAFSCPRCNKVYNWRTNLRRHVRLECGKAPQFHCSFCPYKTKQKAHLTRHIAGRHRYLDLIDYSKFSYDSGY